MSASASGVIPDLSSAPPSVRLAVTLDRAAGPARRYAGVSDQDLVTALGRWHAMEAAAGARKLAAAAELLRRNPAAGLKAKDGEVPLDWRDSVAEEIAFELAISRRAAASTAGLAWHLARRLPLTFAALDQGILDIAKARVIAEETSVLDDDAAGAAEAMIAGDWDGLTPDKLRRRIARAVVLADPEAAARRREESERDSARVRFWRDRAGAMGLEAMGLPTDQALMASAHIQERALAYRAWGITGRLDILRVMALLDLINGTDARAEHPQQPAPHGTDPADPYGQDWTADWTSEDQARASAAASTAAGCPGDGDAPEDDGTPEHDDVPADNDAPAGSNAPGDGGQSTDGSQDDGTWPSDDDAPEDQDDDDDDRDDDGPGNGNGNGNGNGDGDGGPGGPSGSGGPGGGSGPGGTGGSGRGGRAGGAGGARGVRGEREPDHPAHHRPGTGPTARRSARHRRPGPRPRPPPPGPRHPQPPQHLRGHPHRHPGPRHRPRPRQPRPHQTGTGHPAGNPRAGPRLTRTRAGPAGGYGDWILRLGDLTLAVTLTAVPAGPGDCDHQYQTPRYRPGIMLRRITTARDGECTSPICSQASEWDHITPWPAGPTCTCNGATRCGRDHDIKHMPGWTAEMLTDGRHQWTTPSGKTYTKDRYQYPI